MPAGLPVAVEYVSYYSIALYFQKHHRHSLPFVRNNPVCIGTFSGEYIRGYFSESDGIIYGVGIDCYPHMASLGSYCTTQ
jgi:hypothetical protein